MGREIRRVPPGWEHPRYTEEDAPYSNRVGQYVPLLDESYQHARNEWLEGLRLWNAGMHPERKGAYTSLDWWEYEGGPPDRKDYRPEWNEGGATWIQAYETVSEGTPISPPFATAKELIDWLCTYPDFWGYGPQTRHAAAAFVEGGWAPSMVVVGGKVYSGIASFDAPLPE